MACGVFTSAGIAPPASARGEHVDRARADQLGEQRAAGDQPAAGEQRVEQRAALAADREAGDVGEPEPLGRFERGQDRVVVDAEQDVDVGMRLQRVEAGAERGVEDAAAVDPPVADVAVEGLAEAGEEAVAARPGVGQRLERDHQDPRRLDPAGEVARRRDAEVAAGGEVVGAEIGAARLRCGFGEERDAPPPRHQPQRLGALALERRQDDRVGIVEGKADVLAGRAAAGRAWPAPSSRATPPWVRRSAPSAGKARHVAPDGDVRHPPEPRRKVVDRGDPDLVQDREDARFTLAP